MKKWFNHLSYRERVIVIAGSIILGLVLTYTFLWSPLFTAVSQAHHKALAQAQLLRWMQRADRRIQAARSNGIEITSTQAPMLLTAVESTFTNNHLSQFIQSVQQPNHNEVSLSLHEVPFDAFIHCVFSLAQQEGITTKHLKVTATSTKGITNVEITFVQ